MVELRPALEEALARRPRPRLTVVRAGGLGDTLLLVPALRLLRTVAPGAALTLVGSAWAERLAPLIDLPLRVARFDTQGLTPLFAPHAPQDPSGVLAGADAAVVYTADPHEAFSANARRLCPGPVLTWPVRPPGGAHAAVHFARAVAPGLGSGDELPGPALSCPPEEVARAERWLAERFGAGTRPVAVHPGSGGRRKCWPPERFARLIEAVGAPVVLIEGPADAGPVAGVRAILGGTAPVALARDLNVAEVAAVLSLCAACVGNDSGLSHLAAGLGVPTVAVFGPTDPAVWGPLGPAVRAVGGAGRDWPAVDVVMDVLAGWD